MIIDPGNIGDATPAADVAREIYAIENGKAIDKSKILQGSLDYVVGLADFGESVALDHAHPDEPEWEDWRQVSVCLQHIREELTGVMMNDGKQDN
ncbi:hypothetical protein [Limosilactobacillus ingluviei]|uniref:hypothetical protein n=1 Tax=Limosilactobacillus ingluviei TaxID=148604 RepID=UPI0023F25EFC|nr:hypothetical protein [Limosilactobacillus ingluviei]